MDPTLMIPSYFGGYGPPARFRQRNNAVDAKNYDFRAQRTSTHTNKIAASVIHMLMFPLGSGLVAMHAAYLAAGHLSALIINIILSSGVTYCVCILVWTAQKMYGRVQMAQLTYPDLVEAIVLLSPWPKFRKAARCLRYTVEITMALHLYGSCSVFLTMMARNLKELVEGDELLTDDGDPPLKVYILSLMMPCVVVCMATNLKNLAPFALIAVIYAVALIVVTIWYAFKTSPVGIMDRPAFKSVGGLFECSSVLVFSLETASIALPLENYMDQPKKCHYVILITMPILTMMLMITGVFGYWHYGEFSVAPITIHFPFEPFPIQLKVFLCLVLYVTFSMCFYVAFDIEWFYLKRNHQMANYWFWERFYRTIHVVIITLISYGVPRVTRMMGVVGAFCTCPIIFLFPPCLEICVDWEYPGLGRYKWRLVKFIALIMFGLTVFFGGTYINLYSLVQEMLAKQSYVVNMTQITLQNRTVKYSEELMIFNNNTLFDNKTFPDNTTLLFKNGSSEYLNSAAPQKVTAV